MPRPLDAAGDESAQLLDAITVRLGETQQLVTAAARRLGRLEGENAALRAEIQSMRVGTLLSTTDTE